MALEAGNRRCSLDCRRSSNSRRQMSCTLRSSRRPRSSKYWRPGQKEVRRVRVHTRAGHTDEHVHTSSWGGRERLSPTPQGSPYGRRGFEGGGDTWLDCNHNLKQKKEKGKHAGGNGQAHLIAWSSSPGQPHWGASPARKQQQQQQHQFILSLHHPVAPPTTTATARDNSRSSDHGQWGGDHRAAARKGRGYKE